MFRKFGDTQWQKITLQWLLSFTSTKLQIFSLHHFSTITCIRQLHYTQFSTTHSLNHHHMLLILHPSLVP